LPLNSCPWASARARTGQRVAHPSRTDEPVIALIGGLILCVLSVPGIVAGAGLLKLRPWARYLALVLSVLLLFNVPVGTAVGIYSIWALTQDEAEALFANPRRSSLRVRHRISAS